jgi:hypothetical protein
MASDAEASEQFLEEFPEGKWLSYDEIGRIRGIGRASAVKLVQRERWRRIKGNDGTARAFVPGSWIKPAGKHFREHSREDGAELSHTLNALGEAVAALREQTEAERQRAERAEHARDVLQAKLATETEAKARAEGQLEAERDRANRVEQDAAEWWSRSRWQRVRAAWRGRG